MNTVTSLKVARLIVGNSCGPYIFKITGTYSEYFKIVDNFLYFVIDDYDILKISRNYSILISLADPANRFPPVQKNYTLSVFPCGGESVTTLPPGITTTLMPGETTTTSTTVDPSAFPPPINFTLSSETGEFRNPMNLCNTNEQYFSISPHESYYQYPYSVWVIAYEVEYSPGPNYDTWFSPPTQITLSRLTNPVQKTFFQFTSSGTGTVRFRLRASLYHIYFYTVLTSSYIYDPNTYIVCDN